MDAREVNWGHTLGNILFFHVFVVIMLVWMIKFDKPDLMIRIYIIIYKLFIKKRKDKKKNDCQK